MFTLNKVIDAVTVLNQLSENGILTESGGRSYLLELVEITPTAANVLNYVNIVRDKAVLRSLGEAAGEIGDMVAAEEGEINAIVDIAEQKVYSIRNSRGHKGLIPVSRVLIDVYENLGVLAQNSGTLPGVPTGFSDLDAFLTGLNNSDLILLASRPGMGKTSAALNIALAAGRMSGKAVVIFSLEMSNEQLALRLISGEASVDSKKLRTGMISDTEWANIAAATNTISQTKLFLDDTPGILVAEMKAKCRRLGSELGLVIIDYLQLMQSSKKTDNRVAEVSEISRSLKIMAKELNVPVLCLSQLSRAPEQRERDKRPRLSDLRESGAIEQDADVVVFIYRDDYYNKEESMEPGVAEFLIEKNRHGETGVIKLYWDGKHTRFTGIDKIHE